MYIIILLQNEIKHSLSTVIMDTQPFVSIKFLLFQIECYTCSSSNPMSSKFQSWASNVFSNSI